MPMTLTESLTSAGGGTCVPTHTPPVHMSFVVQTLLSSHGSVLFVCVQPEVGLQASVVQTLPSSQALLSGVCWQPAIGSQWSIVQAMPSLHAPSLGVCVQTPFVSSHASTVQGTWSSQLCAG